MPSTINFLRLIADPTRLRMLLLLEQEELSVAELQEILGMGQSRISSHLAQLKRAGAVLDRRAGKNVYYGLKDFSRNGARARVQELVQTMAREIPETTHDRTGLKLAKKHGFRNIEYRLGDMQEPPIARNSVDLAIFSQALHHAPRPERAIESAHSILRKNGRIVILDLLNHSFERARELYADHWLGFSEVQLHQFLENAGFKNIDVRVVTREKQSPNFQTVFAT